MSPASLNFTQLSANAVVPTTGNFYQVQNLAFGHVLDNANSLTVDGNPILSYNPATPRRINQLWSFLTYPSSIGDTVFTLQALNTIQSGSSDVIDGRGGYMRVDPTTNKAVQGGQPQAWKLIQVAPSIYKMAPFENFLSSDGRLVATDVNPNIEVQNPVANQLEIQQDVSTLQQFWTFN